MYLLTLLNVQHLAEMFKFSECGLKMLQGIRQCGRRLCISRIGRVRLTGPKIIFYRFDPLTYRRRRDRQCVGRVCQGAETKS
jgi:hypothetical protein